jgi:outer membrane protein assembly factor BamA
MRRLLVLSALVLAACASTAQPDDAVDAARGHVRFEGIRDLGERGLRRAIALDLADWEQSGFERSVIDDAAFQLELHYRANGFAFAKVEYDAQEGSRDAVLRVTEGPRVRVRGVNVRGLDVPGGLEASAAASYFDGGRTSLLGTDDPLFVQTVVDSARGQLRAEYRARGYRDVEVDAPVVTFSDDRKSVTIDIALRPGRRYFVRDVRPAEPGSAAALSEDTWRELRREFTTRQDPNDAVGVREPRPESPTVRAELRGAALGKVKELGHLDATVDVQRQVEPGTSDIVLLVTIVPGPVVRVGSVRFEGAPSTRHSFLASRLQVQPREGERPGELARPRALREGIARLYRTGLFGRVDAHFEGDGVERDLVLNLDERPSIELFVEPGYGSYELLRLRAGVREKNLFGTGRQLRAVGTFATRAMRFETGITDPWFLRHDLIADFAVTFDERQEPSFTSIERGTGFFVTREWDGNPGIATTVGYQFRNTEAREVELVTDEVLGALEQVNLSSLKVSQVFDRRDNPLLTESGTLSRLSFEWGNASLGSELDFWRAIGSVAAYRRLRRGTVIAGTLRAGAIAPHGGADTIPLQERFFAGGENSVRSFKESELGPKDSLGKPVGGETFTTASLELRQTLGASGFQAALFTDAGVVTEKIADFGDTRDLGWGIGVGLRYLLPVGPLRLDLATNPDAEGDEDDWVLHVAVGLSF